MTQYESADWSIPHCDFRRTSNGFCIEYLAMRDVEGRYGVKFAALILATIVGAPIVGLVVGHLIGTGLGWLAFFAAIALFVWWVKRTQHAHITIEVTPDAVIINDKHLRRQDFGHLTGAQGHLTYQYGNQSFDIEGYVRDLTGTGRKATELASAFNDHLRRVPPSDSLNQPSIDQLRSAAQTTQF